MTYVLRPATPLDASKIGEILYRFEHETPWMPKEHSRVEAIAFCDRMISRGWVTVAEDCSTDMILGFCAQDGAEVCSLYLSPEHTGCGIGKRLLDNAKRQTSKLKLWTFQANLAAQRFYMREGFVEKKRTDGQRNSEGLPDIEYHWHAQEMETAT
ncbi:N-acetyltransferase family protein [Tritonibacter mobilis]|uniref:GNAT family N-acetyltransferase n=1 Tax=Tritonibacter mobilis TaxID=379347 RepID=UPI00398F9523